MKEPHVAQLFRLCFGSSTVCLSIKLLSSYPYPELSPIWVDIIIIVSMMSGVYLLKMYFKN